MKSKDIGRPAALVNRTSIVVRFSELDPMSIVWHGEYVKYFEDGREAFGKAFPGIGYMDIFNSGFGAPVVDLHLQYLCSLKLNDHVTVETRYINVPGPKICFEYVLTRDEDGAEVARGSSVQVFIDGKGEICLEYPPFYEAWKEKWLNK